MTDSKLTNLLKAFSPDEFRQFEKFIDSPYYNKGRDLLPFFKALKSFYPEFNHKNFNNEFIYKKLFPGKKYDTSRSENLIRTLSSHLFKICKEFLVNIELEDQPARKKYFLLNQLRRKKLYKEFDKEFSSIDDTYDDAGKGSVGYFVDRHLISAVKRDCSLNRDDFENAFEYAIQSSENIAAAALISAFKFEDEKNISTGYDIKIRNNLLEVILKNFDTVKFIPDLQKESSAFYPYMQIFSGIYLMNHYKDNKEHFYTLKEQLQKYSSLFGQPENYVLWNIMLTYCGVNKFETRETFELHKYMLDNGIHKPLSGENFHIVLFRNIVQTASAIGEYDWLEVFIEKYSEELHENHRDNMKVFSLAYLCFARSEFEKALEHILKIKYNLFLFKLDTKILQSKIYYELGYYEEGLSLISATLNYLSNSKEVGNFRRDAIGNFAKCLRGLIKIRANGKIKDDELHILKLNAQKVYYKGLSEWLIEKIALLECE